MFGVPTPFQGVKISRRPRPSMGDEFAGLQWRSGGFLVTPLANAILLGDIEAKKARRIVKLMNANGISSLTFGDGTGISEIADY